MIHVEWIRFFNAFKWSEMSGFVIILHAACVLFISLSSYVGPYVKCQGGVTTPNSTLIKWFFVFTEISKKRVH